jgi:PAS domain S-box-containing protein
LIFELPKKNKNIRNKETVASEEWASLAFIVNKKGKIKFITQELASLLGYSISELLGKNGLKLLLKKEDLEEHKSQLSFLYKQESVVDAFDIAFRSSSGEWLDFRFSIIKLPHESNKGMDIAFIGDDMSTSIRHQPKALRESKQVAAIVDNAQEFLLVIDKDEKVNTLNKTAKERLGISEGMSLKDLLDPTDAKRTTSFLSSLGKISSTANINLVLLNPGTKQRFYLRGAVSSVVDGDQLVNFRLILNDVTERTKSEKAKELYYSIAHHSIHSRSLENLYYNIHKELRSVVDCDNLYIALRDKDDDQDEVLSFPYYQEGALQNLKRSQRKYAQGITEFVIDSGKPQIFTKKELKNLAKQKKIVLHGTIPEVWLGVPLRVRDEVIGAIAVQSFLSQSFYSIRDLKLLDFASSQIAMAINMVRTQEQLMAQTAKLNSIIESGSHLIWTVNSELELTSYNQNYFDTIQSNYDILPTVHEGLSKAKRKYPSYWEEKYKRALAGEHLNFEIKLKDNKGNDSWKEIYLNPIYLKGDKIEEVSGIANDITEKKKSEHALVESEEKFRNIFESFQDVYFRCDRNGIINMVSPSVKRLTGKNVAQVIGKNITNLINVSESILPLLRRLAKQQEIENVEVTVKDLKGTLIECICNLRMINDTSTSTVLIEGVVRDVTLLKLTNRELTIAKDLAEESLMVKEQFLANMSHEIRTPLNGIIGVVDLLEQTKLVKEQASYLKTIKASSETLLNILNDILDLSKIEAGKMALRTAPLSFHNLVNKIKALFASRAASQLISLNFHVSKEIPEVIEADEMRVIQVISNLLANSLKFTQRGGSIDLGFELKKADQDDLVIRVDVRDSGIGIDQEDVEKLFTSFTQLDTSTTKSFGGTGLGLAISKQLVGLMGGKIGVSSSPGLGSTFWFSFTAKKSSQKFLKNEKPVLEETSLKHFTGTAPKVLVVDDNLVNRDVAGEILKKSGCKVDLASSGVEAVYKAKANDYDIIFMDIQMPEMDGIEANEQIRSQKKSKPPVVVAMTAYSMKEDRQRFLDAGLDDYIAKPLRVKELINKVDSILNNTDFQIEPTTKKDNPEIINLEVIQQLQKFGGPEMVFNTLKEFETEVLDQLKDCSKALKQQEYDLINKHLHTIKGSAGTIGVERVANLAESLENALKNGDYSEIKQGLKELNTTFAEFRDNFTNIISHY